MNNTHLVAEPGQWSGPAPVQPDQPLPVQIVTHAPQRDGWTVVETGWAYGEDDEIQPARGLLVRAELLHR